MSALDKIAGMFPDRELGKAVAVEILNEHAHELAEEIREASLGMYPTGLCPAISGSRQAANLIDPEVENPEYTRKHIEWHRDAWKVSE